MASSEQNRMIGYPYPKLVNAIMEVDQAACVIMASAEKADALGIPADKRVYLHGCADAADLWNPLDRVNYYSSPAIAACARENLAADTSFMALVIFCVFLTPRIRLRISRKRAKGVSRQMRVAPVGWKMPPNSSSALSRRAWISGFISFFSFSSGRRSECFVLRNSISSVA